MTTPFDRGAEARQVWELAWRMARRNRGALKCAPVWPEMPRLNWLACAAFIIREDSEIDNKICQARGEIF